MNRSVELPFINVRDLVLFPGMTQNLFIGRPVTIATIRYALKAAHPRVLVLTQRRAEVEVPKGLRDMYTVGTVCNVEGSVLLQDKTMKARLAGERLFQVESVLEKDGIRIARGSYMRREVKPQTLAAEERMRLLELFVRAKPMAPIDEEADWFGSLKNLKRRDSFVNLLQSQLYYRSPFGPKYNKVPNGKKIRFQASSSRTRLQQRILEEPMGDKKLALLREYLAREIREAAAEL